MWFPCGWRTGDKVLCFACRDQIRFSLSAYYSVPPPAMSESDPSAGPRILPGEDLLRCFCLGHCPDGRHNGTCVARPQAKCFSAVEEVYDPDTGNLVPERTYGCLPPDESGLLQVSSGFTFLISHLIWFVLPINFSINLFQCQGHLVPHLNPKSIACCSDADFCNRLLTPTYRATTLNEDEATEGNFLGTSIDHTTSIALLISFTVCFGKIHILEINCEI